MQQILKNRDLRRFFWISTLLTLVVLLFIRFFLLGGDDINLTDFFSDLIDSLFATILTTIAVGAMIFYVTPKVDPENGIKFLNASEFKRYFKTALEENPRDWYFRGGFGRYLRTAVIPHLHKLAKDRTPINIKAQILNPKNDKLCELHAHLRNSAKGKGQKWTASDVKINLYATIVTCTIYESINHYLDISVHLIDFFSTDRIDISTNSGILTKDDQRAPGLIFSRDSNHYVSYMSDLKVTEKQASDVVRKLKTEYAIGKIDKSDVQDILIALDFIENFTDSEFEKIAQLVNDTTIPYE